MPPTPLPPQFYEHRVRVLDYLRGIVLPPRSAASEIIEERRPAAERRALMRPGLVLWAASACGGAAGDDALAVAAAFELLDRFTALHDELVDAPDAGDDDTLVARWGLGQVLNAGDALFALALRTLARDVADPRRRLDAAALVTRAVLEAIEGRTGDTAAGDDVRSAGLLRRVRSLRRRSAAMTGASMEAGAIVAGAAIDVRRRFARAGKLIDVARSGNDAELAQRLAGKAVDVVARCVPAGPHLSAFDAIAEYVARTAA